MTSTPNQIKPPEWMTKDFLQASLRSGFHDNDLVVDDVTIKPAGNVGDNYASQMFRVTLDISKGGCKSERLSVVVKILPLGDVAQSAIHEVDAFNKEIKMFTKTLPEMHRLLEEAQPGKFPKLFAECYYYQDPPQEVIILEDLCTSGFRMADRFKGLDLDHAILVMESMASLHASSYVLIQTKKEIIEEYKETMFQPKHEHLFLKLLKEGLLNLADETETWSDFPKHYTQKLREMENVIMERTFKVYERDDSRVNVIVHGDAWINNMMFKYEGNKVIGMKFVDYQLANYNSPVLDLNYFIFSSLKQEVRDNHLEDLLHKYHECFMNTLDTLKWDMDYPFEEFRKNFFDRLTAGFVTAVLVLPFTFVPPKDAPNINDLLDNTSEYKKNSAFQSDQLKNVMTKLLPFFEKHGVF